MNRPRPHHGVVCQLLREYLETIARSAAADSTDLLAVRTASVSAFCPDSGGRQISSVSLNQILTLFHYQGHYMHLH